MKPRLSFVTLLAFDYAYALNAIGSYYAIADEIILGLDGNRLSWTRESFEINLEELRSFIQQVDLEKKIRLVEGNFHSLNRAMENDTQERNALSMECASGNWIVQIDADEQLLNADEFVAWLEKAGSVLEGSALGAQWITVFKQIGDKALVITPSKEFTPVGTKLRGQYQVARWTRERLIVSPLKLLHYSWARKPEEVRQKLRSWSHSDDFDIAAFYQKWEGLTLENFQQWRNFHPLDGQLWPGLAVVEVGQSAIRSR